jgi:PAS domain S-box-containing protein
VQIDAVPWTEPGRRAGCLLLVQDVTDRSRARERVGFQGQLLDNVRESVVATDLDGRVTYWGKGAQNLYGYEPKEVLGRVITFIVDPDQKVEEKSRMRQVLARGLWSGRYRQRRKDGSVFWSDTVISLVSDEQGRPTGFVGIDRDVTAQVRAQQQLVRYQQRLREMARELSRAEDRQRRQLASALHDGVGQNLFGVKAHLESVLQQQQGCSQADHIRDILKVVEDTMSDIRSLTVDICPPILYERGLDAALRYLCETFQERHGIDCVLEGTGGGALAEDLRGLLYQAVRELLNNVAKHARASSARIALHRQKDIVRIRVDDDGVGMSAQEVQEDRPTGFGLFHIREMLQAASGNLRIDSRPGEGTSVELTLPVAGDSG